MKFDKALEYHIDLCNSKNPLDHLLRFNSFFNLLFIICKNKNMNCSELDMMGVLARITITRCQEMTLPEVYSYVRKNQHRKSDIN